MALNVADNRLTLINLEQSMRPEAKELKPLKPMLDTLVEYCKSLDIDLSVEEVKAKLGGHTSVYYQICKLMVKMYLEGEFKKKKRGIILSGVHNSGKSTIARYASNIFHSHVLNQTDGIFAE